MRSSCRAGRLAGTLALALAALLALVGGCATGEQTRPARTAPSIYADASGPAATYQRVKADLAAATDGLDRAKLTSIRAELKQLAVERQDDYTFLAHYYAALADYRLAFVANSARETSEVGRYLDDGLQHLEAATRLDEGFAEGYALMAALAGQKARDGAFAAAYGPKSSYLLGKARVQDPGNPRVYLVEGIGKLYTAPEYGGGAEGARAALGRAEESFRVYASRDPAYPSWGADEVYGWLGQVHERAGEVGLAREAYNRGLGINPRSRWLKALLEKLDAGSGH